MAEWGSRRALRAALPALAWAALLALLSHQSRLPAPLPPFPHVDKLAHAGAFGVLAALVARWLRAAGVAGRRVVLAAAVAASLYGASDEWHQSFVPGRDPDPWDWAADTLGGLLGAAAVGLPRRGARASIPR